MAKREKESLILPAISVGPTNHPPTGIAHADVPAIVSLLCTVQMRRQTAVDSHLGRILVFLSACRRFVALETRQLQQFSKKLKHLCLALASPQSLDSTAHLLKIIMSPGVPPLRGHNARTSGVQEPPQWLHLQYLNASDKAQTR